MGIEGKAVRLQICRYCSHAAVKYPVGFHGKEEWACVDRTPPEIENPDISGCTFGEPGKPSTLVPDYTVSIETQASVYGYDW